MCTVSGDWEGARVAWQNERSRPWPRLPAEKATCTPSFQFHYWNQRWGTLPCVALGRPNRTSGGDEIEAAALRKADRSESQRATAETDPISALAEMIGRASRPISLLPPSARRCPSSASFRVPSNQHLATFAICLSHTTPVRTAASFPALRGPGLLRPLPPSPPTSSLSSARSS